MNAKFRDPARRLLFARSTRHQIFRSGLGRASGEVGFHFLSSAFFPLMTGKPLDLPPAVARAFVKDMRAYFAEPNQIKRDAIAANQMAALQKYQGPLRKSLFETIVCSNC
jgi:hypothetical protein